MQNPESSRPEIVKKRNKELLSWRAQISTNPNIVKKDPESGSLFPICTFETSVLYTKIRNKQVVPGSRFPVANLQI